ncbi:catalase [Corallincola luteus]|uniref:Catalase n=1 Tax=Corallincola luteus TaxID=1775177 RepID=A0ABY2AG30_9GAMM|nr:putative metalloprotease CJM1_0395 family protein [Corallincola luteus]TCI01423.1 catalase [Corallincola luteus]
MNIVMPQMPTVLVNVANPPTDSARRDNQLRELVPQSRELSPYNRETPLGAEKDQSRHISNPLNLSQQYDLSDSARFGRADITEREGNGQQQQGGEKEQQQQQQQAEQQRQAKVEQAEQQVIGELRARDLEVKAHEQAHALVGGQYASAPSYSMERGPDGVSYAVSGEVQIDTSEVKGDPEATLQKLETVVAAALAPAEPSSQDRQVAAEASAKIAQLRNDIAQQTINEFENSLRGNESEDDNGYAEPLSTIGVRFFRQPSGDEVDAQQLTDFSPGGPRSLEISQEIRERGSRIQDFYQRQVNALDRSGILATA